MLAGRLSERMCCGQPLHWRAMQILHVEAGRHLYGGARQVLYLMEGLEKRGIESVLACPEGSAIAEAASSCHVAPLPMGGDLDVGLVPRLRMLINDCQPGRFDINALNKDIADIKGLILPHVTKRNPERAWQYVAALTGLPSQYRQEIRPALFAGRWRATSRFIGHP